MKTKYLTCLMLLAVACSGGQTTGGEQGAQSTAQLKKAAAEARANGTAKGDVCGAEGWYGDGECDTFCQDADTADCGCLLILEAPNGRCDRKADDPCISQDPDCVGVGPGPRPPAPGIVCPAIEQQADGVCRTDPKDPCLVYEDPDCDNIALPPPGDAPPPGVVCAQYIEQSDGICKREAGDPCIFQDPDCPVVTH